MEVRYKREMNHNYLIMEPDKDSNWGYESNMMVSNCIEGLLKFRVRQTDLGQFFYYEITSKQPLSRLLETRYIKAEEIRHILLHIAWTLNRIEEYLLKEEQILLEPGYIYIDPETFTPFLCMVPGYTSCFPDELTKLLQFFLEKVDHKDQESVVLAYSLYHESLKENYGMKDLLVFLTEKKWIQEKARLKESCVEINKAEKLEKSLTANEYIRNLEEYTTVKKTQPLSAEEGQKERGGIEQYINLACLLGIMLAAPFLLWLLKGTNGLKKYGLYLAFGEAAILAGVIIWQVLSIKTSDKKCDGRDQAGRTKWNISPEYLEEESLFPDPTEARQERKGIIHGEQVRQGNALEEQETQLKTTLLADFSNDSQEKEAQVFLISLDGQQESIKIPYTPFLIGKSEELADYCLNKSTVSRLHLRIDQSEDIYTFTDLNSTNGTSIGGRQLETNETVKAEEGDIIYIADLGYQFTRKCKLL